ncbi:MAG: hypothetical protein M3Y59_14075 [Myxococcota bacterium]|nr:hypothetical protein [Myxococcota bacterium]
MKLLAFLLECAAIAALVGAAASLAVWPLLAGLRRRLPTRAALRADLSLLLGLLPAAVTLAVLAGSVAPALDTALTGSGDHCLSHLHHLHLCLVHPAGLRPPLATLGAVALAVFLFRFGGTLLHWLDHARRLASLEALGVRQPHSPAVVLLPGAPSLFHAAGVLRPRILVSAQLTRLLEPEELEAALAHERLHLRRADPLGTLALRLLGAFSLPHLAQLAQDLFRTAAEEACDAGAARHLGDGPVVAAALLKVATFQKAAFLPGAAAFGEHALERRVKLLLADSLSDGRVHSRWRWPAGAVLAALAGAALLHTERVHHAAETLLHHLS